METDISLKLPEAVVVDLFKSKWKLLIARTLLFAPTRFSDLNKELDGVSRKVLSRSLHELEEDGIILRTVFPGIPTKVEYSLSNLGESLRPLLMSMHYWGMEYEDQMSIKEQE